MPNRDWVPLLTLIGIAAVFLTALAWNNFTEYQRYHTAERQHSAQHSTNDARQSGHATCREIESGSLSCTFEGAQSQPADEYAEADLRAQQEMAEWALGVLIVTFVGVIFTGIGIWLLWLTLEATNATLREAEGTTKAALAAAEESKKQTSAAVRSANAAEAQLEDSRNPFFWIEAYDTNPSLIYPNAFIRVENIGDIVGVVTGGYAAIQWVPVNEQPEIPRLRLDFPDDDTAVVTVESVPLRPGHEHTFRIVGNNASRAPAPSEIKTHTLWIYGVVDYRDPSHRDRVLPFMMYWSHATEHTHSRWVDLDAHDTPIASLAEERRQRRLRRIYEQRMAEKKKQSDQAASPPTPDQGPATDEGK